MHCTAGAGVDRENCVEQTFQLPKEQFDKAQQCQLQLCGSKAFKEVWLLLPCCFCLFVCLVGWLVRIRPLQPNRTVTAPWDEGDGFEWAKVDVARVAEPGYWEVPPRRHIACMALHRAQSYKGGNVPTSGVGTSDVPTTVDQWGRK